MSFTITDLKFVLQLIIDILFVWFLIYSLLRILSNNNRTIQIVKGALIVLLIKGISAFFNLSQCYFAPRTQVFIGISEHFDIRSGTLRQC